MAEQRLIDADALREDWLENGENEYVYDTNSFLSSLDDAPTIDLETIPIVRQLREELARVTVERDAAVEQLRGKCGACKHYTAYHNDGLCATCKYEKACIKPWDAVDRWEWRGPQKEE